MITGEETKRKRVKESKRLREKETKRGRDEERGLPQPLPKGKGFVAALMHRTWGSFLESKRRRDKKKKGQRDKESKRGRDGGRILAWRAVL